MDKTEIAAGGRFCVKEPGSALTHFIGLLLASRMRLALRGGEAGLVVGMFYAGMLLVSMTNPGLFCPLPNALLTVLCFAVLEKYTDDSAQPLAKSVG